MYKMGFSRWGSQGFPSIVPFMSKVNLLRLSPETFRRKMVVSRYHIRYDNLVAKTYYFYLRRRKDEEKNQGNGIRRVIVEVSQSLF